MPILNFMNVSQNNILLSSIKFQNKNGAKVIFKYIKKYFYHKNHHKNTTIFKTFHIS